MIKKGMLNYSSMDRAKKAYYNLSMTIILMYKKMNIECNSIQLYFDFAKNGLIAKDGQLTEFTIAGEDKVFHPADAKIYGNTVIVSSEKVDKPIAVRFAWRNSAQPNLFNKEGLPASPFRTDDWPGATIDAK